MPVYRDAVKLHARIGLDVTNEDSMLDDYIRDAVRAVEQDCGRALVMQSRQLFVDRFPLLSHSQAGFDLYPTNNIEVRGCPVKSIDSITYTDYNGVVQTWAPSMYQVNIMDEPCQIRYVWGGLWPIARLQEKSICVSYHCGYVVPYSVASSVLTLSGYTPTNGDTWRVSNSGGTLPGGLALGTDYYVVNASGQTCQLSLTLSGAPITISSAGTGLNFLGELNPLAVQAIYLRVAMNYVDREGAEYAQCERGYWSKIYGLRYEGI